MIIMSMFINRKEELAKLNEIYSSAHAELVLLYGRRRVGKSRMLIESIKDKNALYFLADVSENILDILAKQIPNEFIKFSTWEDFFEFIIKSEYEIIIIDEFQYIYNINKAWPTILQRWWEKIKNTKKKIILCGSIISTIDKISRGYGSALYGRKTREMQVEPLTFKHIPNFLPIYSTKDLIESYAILGGIPRYLEEFDKEKKLEENIKKKIVDKTSFLYNEPLNLLFEEFREPATYIAILLAISEGKNKFNEIADYSKTGTTKLPKYLITLERTKIIEKEIPVTENKMRTKSTKYIIKDNFYRFWLKFIFKNKSQIEKGLGSNVIEEIKKEINQFVGITFEDICREIVLDSNKDISKIGRWWYKDSEIDIVAINNKKKEILFGECKWSDKIDAKKIAKELIEKAKLVRWSNEQRREAFIIFARSFSQKIVQFENKKFTCLDLTDIEEYIQKKRK